MATLSKKELRRWSKGHQHGKLQMYYMHRKDSPIHVHPLVYAADKVMHMIFSGQVQFGTTQVLAEQLELLSEMQDDGSKYNTAKKFQEYLTE